MKIIGLLTILLLLIFSCKKEDLITPLAQEVDVSFTTWEEDPCDEYTTLGTGIGGPQEGTNYRYPQFNPNNWMEIIYYQFNYDKNSETTSDSKLIKYNLITKQKETILENIRLFSQFSWNKKGQIAFIESNNYTTFYINIMNEDGTNKTKRLIDNSGAGSVIKWSNDGKYLYLIRQKRPSNKSYLVKYDVELDTYDELLEVGGGLPFDISRNNQLISTFPVPYYLSMNLNADFLDTNTVYSGVTLYSHSNPSFFPNGYKVFISAGSTPDMPAGLKEFDLTTNTLTHILNRCSNRMIGELNCSNNGRFIIAETVPINGDTQPFGITLIDIKTHKQSVLDLE